MITKEFIAGFFTGEGYFYHGGKNNAFQIGMHLHERDRELLETIADFIGVGRVRERHNKNGTTTIQWTITNKSDIKSFITDYKPYFIGYKLAKMEEYEQTLDAFL